MENLFKAKINTKFVRFLIKRNVKFMVLATTLMIALYPLLAFTNYILSSATYNEYIFTAGRVLLTIVLTLSVFVVPFNLFSYLNSKRNLDVYHALPITRKDLYLSTLISSIIIILIPFTTVFVIGAVYTVAVIPDVDAILLFKQYIYSVALAIASLMPVLFAMMNTGTLIDGLIYSAMLHVLPAIGYGAYLLYGNAILLGFRASSDLLFLLFSSPIFALFDLNFNVDRIYPNVWLVVLYWLLFSFVLTWVILQVYKLRKSEKAETPFTNKWFFPIVSTFFMIVIQVFFFSSFASLNDGRLLDYRTLFFPVVFTFVGYMILDVIANRGFRHFFKALVNFIIITVITLSSFYGSVLTRGLGYITKIPKLESVEQVEFSYNGGNSILRSIQESSYDYLSDYNQRNDIITFSDPDQIQAIIDVHQKILDGYKEINYQKDIYSSALIDYDKEYMYESYGNFSVEYSMSNGSTLSREYTVTQEWLDGLMSLVNTEEFFLFRYPELNVEKTKNYTIQKFAFADPFLTQQQPLNTRDTEAFVVAYKSDYISKSNEKHIEMEPILGFVNLSQCAQANCSLKSYPIRSDDTNTLIFLTQQGVTLTSIPANDMEYLVVLKTGNESNRFFYSPSNTFDFYAEEKKVDVAYISYEEALQLLPYLDYGSMFTQPVNVLRITPLSVEAKGFESPSPFMFYGIVPEGKALLDTLLQDKPTQQKDLPMILYEETR